MKELNVYSVVAQGPKDLTVEVQDPPGTPTPGEVKVQIAYGGICGSDLHYFHSGGFGAVKLREPMILGHEVSGVVAEIGENVSGIQVGDLAAINPSMPCGQCFYCRENMRNQCEDMRFFGSAMRFPHVQGLFREEINIPAGQVFPVQPGTDLQQAACAEPFAVCLHAVQSVGALTGLRVLISGCGPIGCLMTLAAAQAGALEIVATDISPEPLIIAQQFGAHRTIDLSQNPEAMDDFATGKGAFDVVFECSGNPRALASAFTFVRPLGTIVAVGLGGDVTIPLGTTVTKEVKLHGSFRFDAEFGWATELISTGAVDVSPLITHTFLYDRAVEAFTLASNRAQSMKVQLEFNPIL